MIGFAALALALTLATLALLTRPLWWHPRRDRGNADAEQRDAIDVLRQRLRELDAAHGAGSVPDAEHAQARAALEKGIVAAVVGDSPAHPGEQAPPLTALLLGLAGSVCAFAALGYLVVGTPQAISPQPAVARAPGASSATVDAASITPQQIEQLIERLQARLKEQPGDIEGWTILGRSNAVLGRHDAAAAAFKQALALRPDDAALIAHYADALATAKQSFAGEPEQLVARALGIDPGNLEALALAGSAAFDRADFATALRHWEIMARLAPTDEFRARIQTGVAEAKRRLAGQGMAGTTAASSTAGSTVESVAAKSISGSVTLSAALAGKANPDDTLFVYARASTGGGMPLAILRKQVKDLPLAFTLDDSLAMSPQHKLSSAAGVVVGARISRSGNAIPASGDLQGSSVQVRPGSRNVVVEIADVVGP